MERRTLHQQFEDVYQSSGNKRALAILANVHISTMCSLMNKCAVPVTPQNAERLTRIAAALNYSGPLFADEVAE
jgi:hypothetical protein